MWIDKEVFLESYPTFFYVITGSGALFFVAFIFILAIYLSKCVSLGHIWFEIGLKSLSFVFSARF